MTAPTTPLSGTLDGETSDFGADGSTQATEPQEETVSRGPLLDEQDPKKVIKAILKNWRDQNAGISWQLCEVEQAEYWRGGERWVFIRPADTDGMYEIWRPPGIDRMPAMPDKVDQLVRRSTAQLLVDQPKGEAEPTVEEDGPEEAAQLATRIFDVEGGSSGWNFRLLMEGAIDLAYTQKSSFAHVWMDPTGGGEQPVTVLAHPLATMYLPSDPEACLSAPVQKMDPETQQPAMVIERTNTPVTKYLNPDNTLTPKLTADTKKQWVAWPKISLLGFRNVRFLPAWSRGMQDADGVIVCDYVRIGDLKRRYPEAMGKLGESDLKKMVNWQPFPDYQILPDFVLKPSQYGTKIDADVVPDDAVAFVVWEYHQQSPVYGKGAAVCIAGGEYVLGQDDLEVQIEQPDGSTLPVVLTVPVAQCRCINDWVGMSPYGSALVTKLGPWAELMGQQWAAVMDWLDRWNHPNQFLPIGSIVQPNQLAMRTGEPIYVNPQGAPVTEPVPAIPGDVKEFLDRSMAGMDKEALLSEQAQGLESPNVTSGKQAAITINQALVALSSIKENATDFFVRTLTILLERLQAHVTAPRAVEYVGDDGSNKADEWRSVQLVGVKAMRLKQGSFTMLSHEAKKNLALMDVQAGLMTLEEAQDQITSNTRSVLGLDADKVTQRVRRQIDACLNAGTPFDPLPVDDLPVNAQKRFRELAKVMLSARYQKAASVPNAQPLFLQAYQQAKQMAGVMTLPEQQQAQQAAQQQAQQQAAQQEAQKNAAKMQGDQQKNQLALVKDRADAALEIEADVTRKGLGLDQREDDFNRSVGPQDSGRAA